MLFYRVVLHGSNQVVFGSNKIILIEVIPNVLLVTFLLAGVSARKIINYTVTHISKMLFHVSTPTSKRESSLKTKWREVAHVERGGKAQLSKRGKSNMQKAELFFACLTRGRVLWRKKNKFGRN
jgi:hypothetical protein